MQRGWKWGLDQRGGCRHRGMTLQGWVLLDILLAAGLYPHCVPCCHLPRGKRCPQPSCVTCVAPQGCGRLQILRAFLGFCDIPMGNAALSVLQGAGVTLPPCPCPTPAEKVTSLGKDWHRPCLRCERCSKTLTPGGHAEVRVCQPQNPGCTPGDARGVWLGCPWPSWSWLRCPRPS